LCARQVKSLRYETSFDVYLHRIATVAVAHFINRANLSDTATDKQRHCRFPFLVGRVWQPGMVVAPGHAEPVASDYTVPASLMGDAITVLSSNWSDAYNSATSLFSRTPTSTTHNAATLEGIVPSNGANYSGGWENYFRLLENWSSSTVVCYNGSQVAMFVSQYATNVWQPAGIYYNPPLRQWNSDGNFQNPDNLPPLTPVVANFVTP
jgi:hypothetical protein